MHLYILCADGFQQGHDVGKIEHELSWFHVEINPRGVGTWVHAELRLPDSLIEPILLRGFKRLHQKIDIVRRVVLTET